MHRNLYRQPAGWALVGVSLFLLLFSSPVQSEVIKTKGNLTSTIHPAQSCVAEEMVITPELQFQFAENYFTLSIFSPYQIRLNSPDTKSAFHCLKVNST